ncbi:MAG: GTPase HflX [Gemmatimonadaceae bacterium]
MTAPAERALLVGVQFKRPGGRPDSGALGSAGTPSPTRGQVMFEHLEELGELVDTAGGTVVGRLTQQVDRPNPATYLGKGKIEELEQLIAETDASLVIFDDELTPAQGKNIEDATGKRVMDRAELILDIFATRARSSEARMQVELAQLQYMLPRLMRMWSHLEKFRGGIGVRGPGETQLETDRRLINTRIKVLKVRLAEVHKSRITQRTLRKNQFRASLVGYTNAGKSSVLKGLSGAEAVFIEDRLFATLDPLTREIVVAENTSVLLTDTVGFIRKLPHNLVASFRATLEEVTEADLLVHIIDVSHPRWEEQRKVVDQVLAEIGAGGTQLLHVFNKIDRVPPDDLVAIQARLSRLLPGSVFVSAMADDGLEPLARALLSAARARRPVTEIRLGLSDGKMLAEIHREAEVLSQTHDGGEIVIHARLGEALAGRLRRSGAAVMEANPDKT